MVGRLSNRPRCLLDISSVLPEGFLVQNFLNETARDTFTPEDKVPKMAYIHYRKVEEIKNETDY